MRHSYLQMPINMRIIVLTGLLLAVLLQVSSRSIAEIDIDSNTDISISSDAGKKCISDLKLNRTAIQAAFGEDLKVKEGTEPVKKYLACVWKKYGFLGVNGTVNKNRINPFVKLVLYDQGMQKMGEVVDLILKDCGNLTSSAGRNDTAVKVHNCLVNHVLNKKHNITVSLKYPPDENCSSGLNHTIAEKVVNADVKIVEGNQGVDEYMSCLWENYGWLGDDGQMDTLAFGLFVKYLALSSVTSSDFAQAASRALKACNNIRSASLGEKAVKINNCIVNYAQNRNGTIM